MRPAQTIGECRFQPILTPMGDGLTPRGDGFQVALPLGTSRSRLWGLRRAEFAVTKADRRAVRPIASLAPMNMYNKKYHLID